MDYVNDACMYMFTPQQMNAVDAYIVSVIAPSIKPNVCEAAVPGFNIVANDTEIFSCPTTDTEAVFSFTYSTIMDFSETTTFSASGVPAGAKTTFAPTSLNNDGDFTLTIGNIGATAEREYSITVTGTSSTSNITETTTVELKNTCTEIQCIPYASAQNLGLAIPNGTGTTAPANGPPLFDTISLADTGTIESMTVNVDLSHTYVGDLLVRIIHPDTTTEVNIWIGDCGSNDDFDVTFDDDAGVPITCASPTVGTFIPA